jgi:hypothetical protein
MVAEAEPTLRCQTLRRGPHRREYIEAMLPPSSRLTSPVSNRLSGLTKAIRTAFVNLVGDETNSSTRRHGMTFTVEFFCCGFHVPTLESLITAPSIDLLRAVPASSATKEWWDKGGRVRRQSMGRLRICELGPCLGFGLLTLVLSQIAVAAQTDAIGRFVRVTELPFGQVLWMRSAPDYSSKRIGFLPANARHVRNFGCEPFASGTWCELGYLGTRGWAERRYLAADLARQA